jgi:antibiotic biosynthesis monooxygenase (ABM) superfamily enzyme
MSIAAPIPRYFKVVLLNLLIVLYFTWKSQVILKRKNKLIYMKTKMKMMAALKIWLAIYPSITLFLYFFGEALSVLPLYQRTLLLTLSLVPWLVFAGVPFVDFVMRKMNGKVH